MPTTDSELVTRIEILEARLMHQEAALDELTRTLLQQERLVRTQGELVHRLEQLLQRLTAPDINIAQDETPPPHY